MANADLTAERLRELLHYDPNTGIFIWPRRVGSRGRMCGGHEAGCSVHLGYIRIRVLDRLEYAHRLAWLYMKGSWPEFTIDHIDGCKWNNVFRNLRDVIHVVNTENIRVAKSNNLAGLLGVHTNYRGTFYSRIKTNGETVHLGTFDTKEEAYAAYLRAKRLLHDGCTI